MHESVYGSFLEILSENFHNRIIFFQEPSEPTADISGEKSVVSDPVKNAVEDITGPFTAWVNFKLKVDERASPSNEDKEKDEAPGSLSSLADRIKMLLHCDWVRPVFLMMIFFVLAFISAYLVQFVVD